MKERKPNPGALLATLIGSAAAIYLLGQMISVWWLVLTGAGCFGVWMIIWLWPESVPQEH